MTNYEKYPTAEERAKGFETFCSEHLCENCPLNDTKPDCGASRGQFAWLELEAEEKIENCPYCGSECGADADGVQCVTVYCTNSKCGYEVWRKGFSRDKIIAAHNRVARAVMAEK